MGALLSRMRMVLVILLLGYLVLWPSPPPCSVPPTSSSSLGVWDLIPFRILELTTGINFDSLFDALLDILFGFGRAADWTETPHTYVISLDVPGFKAEELKIEVKDISELHVTGNKHDTKEDQMKDKWFGRDRNSHNYFRKWFRMPIIADMKAIKAELENGVLRITVPKLADEIEKRKPKTVNIVQGHKKRSGDDHKEIKALIYIDEL